MTTTTTIVSETYTETETNQLYHQVVDSKKLNNRLDSLRERLKVYKKDKEDVIREMCTVGESIEKVQESVKNKQNMIDDLNKGMNMILKETEKWIDLWKKDEGRLRLEMNTKNVNNNYIQVDQLSLYIMHLREAILNKRNLIEEREINLENQRKFNKDAINEIKNEIKFFKQEIIKIKNKLD
uniref:Acid phosphatase n=1 Tax=Strongyloides stercoralis TaxID=6248 RepID=A0A0K0E0U6_STRER